MFVVIVVYFRRLSVMKTDLANRTGQHNYSSDSSEVNNQPSVATSSSPVFSPETIANNPMYVVNLSPCNPDNNISITMQNRQTGNVFHEPPDYR